MVSAESLKQNQTASEGTANSFPLQIRHQGNAAYDKCAVYGN